MLDIINDILDISRIEADKLEIEKINFSLQSVLDRLTNVIEFKAREKGLKLLFDVAPDLPPVLIGDPVRLGQILTNLANNAVKFTYRGHIKINVTVTEKRKQILLLQFSVIDTCIGISQENQAKLFQRFSQADSAINRQFGGSGLGLSISKKLAQMMGGE